MKTNDKEKQIKKASDKTQRGLRGGGGKRKKRVFLNDLQRKGILFCARRTSFNTRTCRFCRQSFCS